MFGPRQGSNFILFWLLKRGHVGWNGECGGLVRLEPNLSFAQGEVATQLFLGLDRAGLKGLNSARLSNYASATTAQQPNHPLASATTLQQPKLTLASATKPQQPPPLASTCTVTSYTPYQSPNPSGKHMQAHILHVTSKSHPLWQVHAQWHLSRHIKIPPPLPSTCEVTSYTSYQNLTSFGKHIRSHILHVISKSHPLWQEYSKRHLTRSKSHPLWQVHAKSHLTRHIEIPPPLASTCTVTSYTSYQNPTLVATTCKVTSYTSYQNLTPSGKHMRSHILHIISKSYPLASTCKVTSYTIKIPPPLGKYMQSHILHMISKSNPLASTCKVTSYTIKLPPPLATTCTVTSYTSYQNPTPSGNYMHSHILHVISKPHPLWQLHAQSHLTRHIKISPLWLVHAQSHLIRHIKILPPGKHMQSHLLHDRNPNPTWQVHGLRIIVDHSKFTDLG